MNGPQDFAEWAQNEAQRLDGLMQTEADKEMWRYYEGKRDAFAYAARMIQRMATDPAHCDGDQHHPEAAPPESKAKCCENEGLTSADRPGLYAPCKVHSGLWHIITNPNCPRRRWKPEENPNNPQENYGKGGAINVKT